MTKAILITGGLGFIGYSLSKKLGEEYPEYKIVLIDNLSNNSVSPQDVVDKNVFLETGDLLDFSFVEGVFKKYDFESIVHLAAQTNVQNSIKDPFYDLKLNGEATLFLLEEARKSSTVKSFLLSSSNAVSGKRPPPMTENLVPGPISPYGCTKLLGESYVGAYSSVYGIKGVCLRFANVYGPGSIHKGSVVAKFIKKVIDDEEIEIYGDGNQTRDFIHIEDICAGLISALKRGKAGEVYCLGTGKATTVNELVSSLENTISENKYGYSVKSKYTDPLPGDILKNYTDIKKAETDLGFIPRWNIEEGVKNTWDWFLKVKGLE